MTDLRYALRGLLKSPGFASMAILSLALGIGANTAIYSAIRTVLLDALPVKSPEQLVELGWNHEGRGRTGVTTIGSSGLPGDEGGRSYRTNFSYALYRAFHQTTTDSAELFAFSFAVPDVSLSLSDQAVPGSSLLVSGNYFSALGVPMALGRPLSELDDTPEAQPAAVITHRFWTRAFGGDPHVIGKSIRLNGVPFTIVGVTTPAFFGMSRGGFFPPSDVIMPLAVQPLVDTRRAPESRSRFGADDMWWLHVMARVQPGSVTQLEAALSTTLRRSLVESGLAEHRGAGAWDLRLFSAARGVDAWTRGMRQPLLILGGVVAVVLLIACVNVGNLMLARGVARQKEMSIRLALGSSRWRLARGILVEAFLLALAGGALGAIVGAWGGRVLLTMLAGTGKTALDAPFDERVLALTAIVSGIAALLFGVAPALRAARGNIAPELSQVATGATAPRLNSGKILMVAQVAISVPLLVGSALFLRTVYNLGNVDLGFNPNRLLICSVDPSLSGYEGDRLDRFYDQLFQRLETIPGVTAATLADIVLLSGVQNNWPFSVGNSEPKNIKYTRIGRGYFDTIGIPIVTGRAIGVQDHADAPRAAVVNESAARTLFGRAPAVGQRITMRSEPPVEYEIVGVAKDSRYTSPRDPMPPTVYLARAQTTTGGSGPMNIVVRSAVPAGSLSGLIRAAVADVDRGVPVIDMRTQSEQIDQTLGTERTLMRLLIAFGAFALGLASIGLHGLTTYSVARRTKEIGVRVALGAQRDDVLRLILRQVVAITIAGLALGIPAAVATTQLARANLYGVEPGDPLSLVGSAVVMAVVAGVAGFVPARRAASLDPLVALRHE